MSEAISTVSLLWRQAFDSVLHGAGCSCCGGQPVRLDAATLEQDVLFYLHRLYAAGHPRLFAIVEDRQSKANGNLAAWLGELRETVSPEDIEQLADDLTRILRSIGGARAQSANFSR